VLFGDRDASQAQIVWLFKIKILCHYGDFDEGGLGKSMDGTSLLFHKTGLSRVNFAHTSNIFDNLKQLL